MEPVPSESKSESDIPLIDLAMGGSFTDEQPPKRTRRTSRSSGPTTAQGSPKKRSPLPPWRDGVISEWATNLYRMGGEVIEQFDEPYGQILQNIAVPAGQAWENLARDSPQLRRFFHWMMTTGKLSELVFAHTPLFMYMLHRYGPARDRMEDFAEKFANEMEKQSAA